jgi:hypothetical protein
MITPLLWFLGLLGGLITLWHNVSDGLIVLAIAGAAISVVGVLIYRKLKRR